MNKIWHYGKDLKNGKALVKLSRRSNPVETKIPTRKSEVVDIYTALAGILLTGKNLMRVSRYFCSSHRKFHRFTFHSEISFTFPRMIGLDNEKQVIEFAKELFKE